MFAKMFYVVVKTLCRWVLVVGFRARAYHAERVPREGALILAANHQSYLDPPFVGAFIKRAASYIARAGLFKWKPFGACLRAINCVPIREDSGDAGAIKEAIRRLEGGHAVLIFPEGSRSPDGAMHEYKRGVALLVKRAKCPVVPVAVEGCWDAWPRGGKARWFVPVAVMYGHAIAYEELMKDGADAALARLARETQAMRMELRAKLRERTGGKYPAAGAGDLPVVWRKPWHPIAPAEARKAEVELRRELCDGHALLGRTVVALAARQDCDDVLFRVDGERAQFAVVHLTYAKETQPQWPETRFFDSIEAWKKECFLPDAEDFSA